MKYWKLFLWCALGWGGLLHGAWASKFNCPGIAFGDMEIHVTSGVHPAGEVISRPKTTALCKIGSGAIWYHYKISNPSAGMSSGQTYNDGLNNYTIWKTGIPGIGYIVNAYYESGEAVGGFESGNLPLTTAGETEVRATSVRIISWAKARPTITLVTTGEDVILPGQYDAQLPAVMYHAAYYPNSEGAQATFNLHLRFGVAAQACTASSSSYTVNMGTIPSTRFSSVGTEVVGMPFTVTINCKDPNVGVSGLFSDFSELGNTSSYLNLTPDSTAKGIKVQLESNHEDKDEKGVIAYDNPGNAGYSSHAVVIKPPTADLSATFSVTPKYVQTDRKVTGGTANAISVITFIYD